MEITGRERYQDSDGEWIEAIHWDLGFTTEVAKDGAEVRLRSGGGLMTFDAVRHDEDAEAAGRRLLRAWRRE